MTDSQESDNLLVERKDTNEDEADNDLSDALAALSLTTELDSALISHLNLLDDYMFHVECLFQQFRMAFFDLAIAKRDQAAQGGVKIGELSYDERMQALRRIAHDINGDDLFLLQNFMQSKDSKDATESKDTKLIDPIRWYGVLAPQSLKEAQSRFIKALEETIEVANLKVKLQTSESAIQELRQRQISKPKLEAEVPAAAKAENADIKDSEETKHGELSD